MKACDDFPAKCISWQTDIALYKHSAPSISRRNKCDWIRWFALAAEISANNCRRRLRMETVNCVFFIQNVNWNFMDVHAFWAYFCSGWNFKLFYVFCYQFHSNCTFLYIAVIRCLSTISWPIFPYRNRWTNIWLHFTEKSVDNIQCFN